VERLWGPGCLPIADASLRVRQPPSQRRLDSEQRAEVVNPKKEPLCVLDFSPCRRAVDDSQPVWGALSKWVISSSDAAKMTSPVHSAFH
jgi:hypothetical protein